MDDKTINIMGETWKLQVLSSEDDKFLIDCNGYCDWTIKTIVIRNDVTEHKDFLVFQRKTLRHEIIHAFLFECGLAYNSSANDAWATNEEMVDWFAIVGDRIIKAWREAEVLL